jgi:hypothetical protein
LFIKSGLTYFYYISALFLITFIFLGRSKAEQYFGFLPFFTYINFLLGYLPLVLSDFTSQIIIIIYAFYTFLYKFAYRQLAFLFRNILFTEDVSYLSPNINTKIGDGGKLTTERFLVNTPNWFGRTTQYHYPALTNVSKTLSQLRKDLLVLNNPNLKDLYRTEPSLYNLSLYTTLKPIHIRDIYSNFSITNSESAYTGRTNSLNYKTRNTSITLNYLNNLYKVHHSPTVFNFNIKSNLDIANQQRWLTRNSLLTESIVHNSFIFTQAKKLIGTGLLNKDFTNQTL